MVMRIREVRRARGLTLDAVARRCDPPTTPQTIGRFETGARAVSVSWLQRIAAAMDVEAQDLLGGSNTSELKVVAVVGRSGVHPPTKAGKIAVPRPASNDLAVLVTTSVGEYRAGDEIWCEILAPDDYRRALNRDVLVPRAGDRFLFGRLINRDQDKLQILPLEAGGRQQVVASPAWLAIAKQLVRRL